MIEPWKAFAGVLQKVFFHLESVIYEDYVKAKHAFFLSWESNEMTAFLKKINFHNLDQVILQLQVHEGGPVPREKDNVGESFHLILERKKIVENAQLVWSSWWEDAKKIGP